MKYVIKVLWSKSTISHRDYEQSDNIQGLKEIIIKIRNAGLEIPSCPYVILDRETNEIIYQ